MGGLLWATRLKLKLAALAGSVIVAIALIAPKAQAINLGPFQGIADAALKRVGDYYGVKLSKYTDIAFEKLEEKLGIDLGPIAENLGSGTISPETISDAIAGKIEGKALEGLDDLNNKVESDLQKGEAKARVGGRDR